MVLLFLRDWRSAAIVVVTIPFALLAAVVALWGAGPDDQHHDARRAGAGGRHPRRRGDGRDREHPHASGARRAGRPRRARRERRSRRAAAAGDALGRRGVRAVVLHDRRVAVAVRAAVARGRLLDDRVVPPLELARAGAVGLAARRSVASRRRGRARGRLGRSAAQAPGAGAAAAGAGALAARRGLRGRHHRDRRRLVGLALGREIFPAGGAQPVPAAIPRAGRHEVRVDRAAGRPTCSTRSSSAAGPDNVEITLGYVGVQPSSYPINTIFLWTGGSHEGVLQVALKPDAPAFGSTDFEEALRRRFSERFPDRAVLVRAGRHRQPDHELRRADAGRGRDHGPGLRRQPDVCRRRCATSSRAFPRCAICSTSRRSTTRRFRST